MELKKANKINFLGVALTHTTNNTRKIQFSIFRKHNSLNTTISYYSNHPLFHFHTAFTIISLDCTLKTKLGGIKLIPGENVFPFTVISNYDTK